MESQCSKAFNSLNLLHVCKLVSYFANNTHYFDAARVFKLNATREVIISAGAVMTPQLLMLSGIGNTADLTALNIRTLLHIPDVGKNVQDHSLVAAYWTVNDDQFTLDGVRENDKVREKDLREWENGRKGPLVNNDANFVAWLRNPSDVAPFNTLPDPRYVLNIMRFSFTGIHSLVLDQLQDIMSSSMTYANPVFVLFLSLMGCRTHSVSIQYLSQGVKPFYLIAFIVTNARTVLGSSLQSIQTWFRPLLAEASSFPLQIPSYSL
jgi:hypothetical protein